MASDATYAPVGAPEAKAGWWLLGTLVLALVAAAFALSVVAVVQVQELRDRSQPAPPTPPATECNCSLEAMAAAHGNAVLYFQSQIVPRRGRVVFDAADGAYQVEPYYYEGDLYGLAILSNGTYALDWSVMVVTDNATLMSRVEFCAYEGAVNDTSKEYNTILSSRRAAYVPGMGSIVQLAGSTLTVLLAGDVVTLRNLSDRNATVDTLWENGVSECAVGANLRVVKVSDYVPADLNFFTSS